MNKQWFVYVAKCKDNSLYTGITTNPKRRERQHNNLNGAKSVRGKLPVKIIYTERYPSQQEAAKRESTIKSWKREYKLKLVQRKLVKR
ncbi:hypothetical protein A3A66_02015 [Microgenomates group bacterium RIFCSPLOWO2_01_FULL_46_13]|nr:MAG: hypothetical protein A2783_01785 [Microgenomates group bacterium RIFCSPHIGHO2_01_FULL_45_11]OGV94754.1 MAG: hypothetical protein A3A66_02015 [Microgenomates group bacterium RIFCSPLOWO2_01_FULL_46_13]